ncbi:VOC family protein [Defluviimonas salinarum]|uniref:VOC family protein n=1 Tax=Defluviimonas salinarum TaxID=2992147 RepID=A0ABT3IYP7_9RHOB|nr:VOC family protein [Defluviimonas salinarum]MCW3780557.1 VOC family protein [Defluviimonas salinarum]
MEKVLGFGGFFFRAEDPAALAAWYETYLGIAPAPTDMEAPPWRSSEGVVVFAPFPKDTDYFPPDRAFMLNFRVADLAAMLVQLHQAGIAVSNEMTMDGIGRFARIHDPEGNPIELWEPA